MAEILIVIAIIGIVAVMIFSTIYKKIEEKRTIAQVKSNIETFSHAYRMVLDEYGSVVGLRDSRKSIWKQNEIFFDAMAKYLKISKKCGLQSRDKACFPKKVRNLSKTMSFYWWEHNNIIMGQLTNGVSFWLLNYSEGGTQMLFDINGGDKGPNILGVDQFYFNAFTDEGINVNKSTRTCDKKIDKTNKYQGGVCYEHILKYNNMDYWYK